MIKRLVFIATMLSLLAPALWADGSRDSDIVFYTGSAITQDRDAGSTFYQGYFGQYAVRGSGCCGLGGDVDYRRFAGDPEGEIVVRWNVYFLDPEKKDKPYPERILDKRYFYARAPLPGNLPPRSKKHSVFEVYLSFGPRNVYSEGLHPSDKAHARPIQYPSGVQAFTVGEIDTVYFLVRSRPKDAKPMEWPSVDSVPYRFTAVKGIEITRDQYMTIACEQVGSDKCKPYLGLDAPGLTPKQIAYITQTEGGR